jgi:polyketide cyclase/dehydrase/lipid transport protein
MKRLVQVSKSALIAAPAQAVYSVIADYRNGHPRILPLRYFHRLEVERGGSGAGTIIRFEVRLFGTTRRVRSEISEPRPGQELVETDLATGARTTFLVVPRAGGRESEVTIRTEWESAHGLRGWLERMMAPSLVRRIYAEELTQLGALLTTGSSAQTRGPA